MKILKFGGKSLETPEKMQIACKFIKKTYKIEQKIIVVVSAMGSETSKLTKLAENFGYNGSQKRELASLLSTGEIKSATLFCMMLKSMGVPAISLTGRDIELHTFGDYLNSKVCYLNKSKISENLNKNNVCVICGFQGINSLGETVTLGFGGSDTTATALAASFNTPVEIYSDFSGVFAGDPNILNFKKIKKIDYKTMLSLANSGAKVLDEKALTIAEKHNIKIISKATAQPMRIGTEIFDVQNDEIGISEINGLCKISVAFSNSLKFNKICNAVLKSLSDYKFFDLKISSEKISFYIFEKDKERVFPVISKKLKLLSEKNIK